VEETPLKEENPITISAEYPVATVLLVLLKKAQYKTSLPEHMLIIDISRHWHRLWLKSWVISLTSVTALKSVILSK
jgi:hypothetical protein